MSEYDQSNEIENLSDEGILIQTQYVEFTEYLGIDNSDLVPEIMANTNLNVTTQGNSKLRVTFTENFVMRFSTGFAGSAKFNVTLSIVGLQNKTLSMFESRTVATTVQESSNRFVQVTLETGILPAATYSIVIFWYSEEVVADTVYLFTYDSRSLYAQELVA